MMYCESCKNKNSIDRCSAKALENSRFCGKHIRVKSPRIWFELGDIHKKIILIQKVWKGYTIRYKLKLAGPCVLNRSKCHNDEELIIMENKKSVHPLDYFAFEESGKVYWFHISSIIEHCMMTKVPTNPYTRQELKIEDRKRLRELKYLRNLKGLPLLHEKKKFDMESCILHIWINVCQIIEENGFFDLNPRLLMSMNYNQSLIFLNMIQNDLKAYMVEHKNKTSRRYLYYKMISLLMNRNVRYSRDFLSYKIGYTLLYILNDCYDNYTLCFIIMSSLYRL